MPLVASCHLQSRTSAYDGRIAVHPSDVDVPLSRSGTALRSDCSNMQCPSQAGRLQTASCTCGLVTNSAFVNSVPLSVWIIRMGKKAVRTRFNRNILDRELAVFLAVGHAIGRDEFDVHLEFLSGYAARSYGLFWAGTLLFSEGLQFRGCSLEATCSRSSAPFHSHAASPADTFLRIAAPTGFPNCFASRTSAAAHCFGFSVTRPCRHIAAYSVFR